MFDKNSDMMRWIMKHRQDLRRSQGEQPSQDTLNMWSLEDQRDQFLLNMYLDEEAANTDEFNVIITSEVRNR